MGYVAIRGGEQAIEQAANAMEFLRSRNTTQTLDTNLIENQLHALHGKVLSEGGLYHPELASLAIKQCAGDTLEAAFFLRAYRSTLPRLAQTPLHSGQDMRLIRRVSAAFKDIPGGQMLGPTPDYLHRLFRFDLLDEDDQALQDFSKQWLQDSGHENIPDTFPKVLDALRAEGLLPPSRSSNTQPFDITREPLSFPAPRDAALSTMARAETGGLLSIAYSNMRGYGDIHPTVAELRVGYVPVFMPHSESGEKIEIGEALITECEIIAMYDERDRDGELTFGIGYGACFGHNEVKAIAMAILDRSLERGRSKGASNPSEDEEFVLLHVDGVDSMGFCTHYKMPHYVTFQSDLDRLRKARQSSKEVHQ